MGGLPDKFKAKVALEAIRGVKTLAQLAAESGLGKLDHSLRWT
jgi:hypothetical protein